MNRLFLLILALLIFHNLALCQSTKNTFYIQVNVGEKVIPIPEYVQPIGVLDSVSIDLINNTDTTIIFWAMSCAWDINWVFNKKGLELFIGHACDFNTPYIYKIEPGKKHTFKGLLNVSENITYAKDSLFELGLIFIYKNEVPYDWDKGNYCWDDLPIFSTLLSNKKALGLNIICSEPFKLKE
jgi:hypothetical protein